MRRWVGLALAIGPSAGCFIIPNTNETADTTGAGETDEATAEAPGATPSSSASPPSSAPGSTEGAGSTSAPPAEDGRPQPDGSSGDPFAFCGDGFVDADEECDDGNDVGGDLCSADCELEVLEFPAVDGVMFFDVPAWVEELRIEAYGAQGGFSMCCGPEGPDDVGVPEDNGGLGGYASATFLDLAQTRLWINVGAQGELEGAGGYNGGGAGGQWAGGGGGASDVRLDPNDLGSRVLVAGGGGGGNCGCPRRGDGGAGGGLSGLSGSDAEFFPGGGGGGLAQGGEPGGDQATAGGLGVGGSYSGLEPRHVAGGGGGWYGGGAAFVGGAGGGSSYWDPRAVDPETIAGVHEGHGVIVLSAW